MTSASTTSSRAIVAVVLEVPPPAGAEVVEHGDALGRSDRASSRSTAWPPMNPAPPTTMTSGPEAVEIAQRAVPATDSHFVAALLQRGVRHEEVPHHAHRALGVGGDPLRSERRDHDGGIGDLRREATVAADDAEDRRTPLLAPAAAPERCSPRRCARRRHRRRRTPARRRQRGPSSPPATPRTSCPSPRRWCAPSARRRCRSARTPRTRTACGSRSRRDRRDPAEPPTPRMKRRPPPSRTAARPSATASTIVGVEHRDDLDGLGEVLLGERRHVVILEELEV